MSHLQLRVWMNSNCSGDDISIPSEMGQACEPFKEGCVAKPNSGASVLRVPGSGSYQNVKISGDTLSLESFETDGCSGPRGGYQEYSLTECNRMGKNSMKLERVDVCSGALCNTITVGFFVFVCLVTF